MKADIGIFFVIFCFFKLALAGKTILSLILDHGSKQCFYENLDAGIHTGRIDFDFIVRTKHD